MAPDREPPRPRRHCRRRPRSIEESIFPDGLLIDVVLLGKELQASAVRAARRAGGVGLRRATFAPALDRSPLRHQHAGADRHRHDGDHARHGGQSEYVPDLLRRHSANDARLRHEGAVRHTRRRAFRAVDAHILRGLAGHHHGCGRMGHEGKRRRRSANIGVGVGAVLDLRHEVGRALKWLLEDRAFDDFAWRKGKRLGGSPACSQPQGPSRTRCYPRALTLRSTSPSHACCPPNPPPPAGKIEA